jgi:hypothetical protein
MSLIMTGSLIIPPPAGVDVADAQSIAASMHAFELKHFVFPILAHALGTLVGATTAFLIAASNEIVLAYVIGVAFLAGGIAASFMIPAPVWFIILDLLVAYLPMAWLGTLIGSRIKG